MLPTDPVARKAIPLCTGVYDYFPDALAEVAKVSVAGNIQHNGPDAELHWSRGKSSDFADTIARHLQERGGLDTDGQLHSAKLAWRALALLQIELEVTRGLPPSRASRSDTQPTPPQDVPAPPEQGPYPHEVKAIAYLIDPECWISYSGQSKAYKRRMERRRVASLEQGSAILAGDEAVRSMI